MDRTLIVLKSLNGKIHYEHEADDEIKGLRSPFRAVVDHSLKPGSVIVFNFSHIEEKSFDGDVVRWIYTEESEDEYLILHD